MKQEVNIPEFPGFYNSVLSDHINREIEMEMEGLELTYEEIEPRLDYGAANLAICRAFTNEFSRKFGIPMEFKDMTSPREYNFTTDCLFVEMDMDILEKMKKEVDKEENKKVFQNVLNQHFRSRSGFISFYEADRQDYISEDGSEFDHNIWMAYLQAYIMIMEEMDYDDFRDAIYEICESSRVYEAASNVFKS